MKIIVIGAGRTGLVSAVCYAQFGHSVSLVDIDAEKMEQIATGHLPFLETGLLPMLLNGLSSGLLHVTTRLEECCSAEAFLLCLPTPSLSPHNGAADLSSIKEAFVAINRFQKKPSLIIIRSTVPPFAIRELFRQQFISEGIISRLVVNPEFLREGSAVADFLDPPFCIAGGDNPEAVQQTLSLYEQVQCEKYALDLESAALLKYACNAFHALKVVFANEIGHLASKMGADGTEVMRILASDRKLNASSAYLTPGFSFGGPCLGKDLRSIVDTAHLLGLNLPIIENIMPSNEAHLRRCVDAIVARGVKRVGLIGTSFKRGTGELRHSPYMAFAKLLEEESISIRLYDPEVAGLEGKEKLRNLLEHSELIAMVEGSLIEEDREQIEAFGRTIIWI